MENYFHPFRASERFTIVPSWEDYSKESEDELCIELIPEWLLVLEIIQQQVCV